MHNIKKHTCTALNWLFKQTPLGRAVEWHAVKCFGRVVRRALHYKYTVALSVLCSLLVGFLWGGNIAVVYPFVEVVFRGESFHDWIDRQITTSEETSAKLSNSITDLEKQLAAAGPAARPDILRQIEINKGRLQTEEAALARSRKQEPYIKRYLPDDPFKDLVIVVTLLILGTLLKSLFLVANIMLVTRAKQMAIFDLQNEFFQRTLRMDLATLSQDRTSGLLSRFTYDVRALEGGIDTLLGAGVREPLKMIACLVGAALISWQLLLFSLIVTPFGLILMRRLMKSMMNYSGKSMDVIQEVYGRLSEAFNGIKVVKAFTMEKHEEKRFHDTTREFVSMSMRMVKYFSLFKPVTELMSIVVVSLAILAGAHLVLNEATHVFGIRMGARPLSAASLMMFFALLAGMADPARKMSNLFAALFGGIVASQRIFAMMDREPAIQDPADPVPVPPAPKELVFDDVEFHYQPDEPVLKGINLRIRVGETLALVGQNGCGKSTLVNMIPRFYDPIGGAVKFDDVDLRDVRLPELRGKIGIVTQETTLFDEPVIENIRYGSPQASDDQVVQAAQRAHAHEFITTILEQGYQTVVGQGGTRLSGGQRQRIALARAILRDPQIFVLDEATSQIDIESERLIHQALQSFVRDRTTIIISHRLSTLALADRIVVMESGCIVDVGTHDELLARCETYRSLHTSQVLEAA